jgi:hypothetical protein
MARWDAAARDRRQSAAWRNNKNPGGMGRRVFRQHQPLAMPMAMIVMIVMMEVADAHANRTNMHADNGGIGGGGHQAECKN